MKRNTSHCFRPETLPDAMKRKPNDYGRPDISRGNISIWREVYPFARKKAPEVRDSEG